ncbi:MAG TPA: NADPH-dependent FMN reductase, partial [Polyangia bacterium]
NEESETSVALIVTLSGSPSLTSRTLLLAKHINARLLAQGFDVELLNVRDLPADGLIQGRADVPEISAAVGAIERADALVVATPVYKSAYSGVLKTFLDLLPQFALAGKVVFPVTTGGTIAHVLSIDYALRPVLHSMGASHVTNGYFFLDKTLEVLPTGHLGIDAAAAARFEPLFQDFVASVQRRELVHSQPVVPAVAT